MGDLYTRSSRSDGSKTNVHMICRDITNIFGIRGQFHSPIASLLAGRSKTPNSIAKRQEILPYKFYLPFAISQRNQNIFSCTQGEYYAP
jgi:hypothetical protein